MNEDLNIYDFHSLRFLKDIKPKEFEILHKRQEFYIKNLIKAFKSNRNLVERHVDKEVFSGKTIRLLNSFGAINFKLRYPEHKLFITEDNFGLNYVTFKVFRNYAFSEKLYYALVFFPKIIYN